MCGMVLIIFVDRYLSITNITFALKTEILVRLSYSNIFNQRRTVESLKNEVDIKDSLSLLSAINKNEYKLRKEEATELKFILNEWLIEENEEIKNKILSAYTKHSEKRGNQLRPNLRTIVLINRISTLRLMEVLCSINTNDE